MSNNNNVNKSANSINIKQQKSNFESLQFSRAPKCFQYFNTFQNAATPFEEEIDLPSAKSKEITQRWEAHMHYFHHCLTCEMRSGLFATDCLVEGLPKVHSRLVDRVTGLARFFCILFLYGTVLLSILSWSVVVAGAHKNQCLLAIHHKDGAQFLRIYRRWSVSAYSPTG
jgi:hypothetical protein